MHMDVYDKVRSNLSRNPAVTLDIIYGINPGFWDWCKLAQNPSVTIEFIETYAGRYSDISDDCALDLLISDKITYQFAASHPEVPFDFALLMGALPDIPKDHAIALARKGWALSMSTNSKLDIDIVVDYPDFNWDYYSILVNNGNLTQRSINIIIDRTKPRRSESGRGTRGSKVQWRPVDISESISALSENPWVTPEYVRSHPNYPWNYERLSHNQSVTPEFVYATIQESINKYGKEPGWDFAALSWTLRGRPFDTLEKIVAYKYPEKYTELCKTMTIARPLYTQ